MGLLDVFRLTRAVEELGATAPTLTARPGIRSPWTTAELSKVVWSDIFGVEAVPLTRAEAMRVPAVARSRHLLAGTIARLPLVALDEAGLAPQQQPWLSRTIGASSPFQRMLWTVDDLLFGGWSLWGVLRADDGTLLEGTRVPAERWHFDPDGTVIVDEQEVQEESVLLIPGPHEGLLSFGAGTIRQARLLEESSTSRARNPVPTTELHQVTDDELEEREITDLVTSWRKARQDPDGAVAYTPSSIELKTHQGDDGSLLISARNSSAIDVARHAGIPASMIDASNVNSTLTYETQAGRNGEFRDYGLSMYLGALEGRLSQDDVVPPGQRVRFDLTDLTSLTPSPTGPTTKD